MEHPERTVFELFVLGALTKTDSDVFIAHVSSCETCSKTLRDEAQAELAVREVHAAAKRVARVKRPAATRLRMWGGAGALALAASIAFFVLSRHRPQIAPPSTMTVSATKTEPIPLVVCPDGLGQEKCVEDAHRHGLFVSYPPWASAPPLVGSGRGPNASPFASQM